MRRYPYLRFRLPFFQLSQNKPRVMGGNKKRNNKELKGVWLMGCEFRSNVHVRIIRDIYSTIVAECLLFNRAAEGGVAGQT